MTMQLSITTTDTDDARTIAVEGEIDVSCASELRDAIDAAIQDAIPSIDVDLAGTSYIDSTGIGVLVGAANRAAEAGLEFSVSRPQRNVSRVLDLLGVGDELHVRGDSD
jgi:anti-sigma B factor antagonist